MAVSSNPRLRYGSLALLVVQNVILVTIIKYAQRHKGADGKNFISQTAVVMDDLFKIVFSLVMQVVVDGSPREALATFQREIPTIDTLKVAVPGMLYCLQTNMLYVAIARLPVPVYQVTSQLKILTTAFFSVVMLRKKLSLMQGVALLVLAGGISVVQLAQTDVAAIKGEDKEKALWDQIVGLVAVVSACFTSGFAGVYFEKILKHGRPVTLFVRNVQLSAFGLAIGLGAVATTARAEVIESGFFQGYTPVVWLTITVQASGGLLVAMVIKYADNILKSFAAAVSIVAGSIASVLIFGTVLTPMFDLGAAAVMVATVLYARFPPAGAAYAPLRTKEEGEEQEQEERTSGAQASNTAPPSSLTSKA